MPDTPQDVETGGIDGIGTMAAAVARGRMVAGAAGRGRSRHVGRIGAGRGVHARAVARGRAGGDDLPGPAHTGAESAGRTGPGGPSAGGARPRSRTGMAVRLDCRDVVGVAPGGARGGGRRAAVGGRPGLGRHRPVEPAGRLLADRRRGRRAVRRCRPGAIPASDHHGSGRSDPTLPAVVARAELPLTALALAVGVAVLPGVELPADLGMQLLAVAYWPGRSRPSI